MTRIHLQAQCLRSCLSAAALLLLFSCAGGTTPRDSTSMPAESSTETTESPSDAPSTSSTVDPMGSGSAAQPPADEMQIFLLIGQSNMEGMPKPQAEDLVENERIRVLGYEACNGRTYNAWDTAAPPLHHCWAGLGPGDYFAKALAEAWPDTTIGLVPCAISGVDIDFFRKGIVSARRAEFTIPPDNTRDSAYDMVIERAQLAQQSGRIRGILFHQGESDTGNAAWLNKVEEMVADLRTDLALGEDVPFIAGELLYTGCCSSHNPLINQLPGLVPNTSVVSADGLVGVDEAHFDLAGQRELGRRYAQAFLTAIAE